MLKKVGLSLATAALLAVSAHAGTDVIRKDVKVSYSDLDLNTQGGADQLVGRISYAAKLACGSSPSFYSYYSVAPALANEQFNTCRANAIKSAVQSVPSPLVQKYLASKEATMMFASR